MLSGEKDLYSAGESRESKLHLFQLLKIRVAVDCGSSQHLMKERATNICCKLREAGSEIQPTPVWGFIDLLGFDTEQTNKVTEILLDTAALQTMEYKLCTLTCYLFTEMGPTKNVPLCL